MGHKKAYRIKQIEREHGVSIEQVFQDYAKLYSWHFTCKDLLRCGKDTFKEYKHYFKLFKSPKREKTEWVARSNTKRAKRFSGLTIPQMQQISGLSNSTLRYRLIVLKWTADKAMKIPPAPRGDITRIPKNKAIAGRKKLKSYWG